MTLSGRVDPNLSLFNPSKLYEPSVFLTTTLRSSILAMRASMSSLRLDSIDANKLSACSCTNFEAFPLEVFGSSINLLIPSFTDESALPIKLSNILRRFTLSLKYSTSTFSSRAVALETISSVR